MRSVSRNVVRIVNELLRKTGYRLVSAKRLKQSPYERIGQLSSYRRLEGSFEQFLRSSKSQYGQEWLVSELLGASARAGYFVEFGAINGIHNSNTYFLETELKWSGIVCEPARKWHRQLHANRSCAVDERCVYSSSGEFLDFIETGNWKGGNTLFRHRSDDGVERDISDRYQVETISLNDLLEAHNAPRSIDFLSIDTEGSELEILKTFDFNRWSIELVTVEHNNSVEKRDEIRVLFEEHGYHHLPISDAISGVDDWYASSRVYEEFVLRYRN